ncbi:FMN reductase (NADH) RutF, partial [Clarias magur]
VLKPSSVHFQVNSALCVFGIETQHEELSGFFTSEAGGTRPLNAGRILCLLQDHSGEKQTAACVILTQQLVYSLENFLDSSLLTGSCSEHSVFYDVRLLVPPHWFCSIAFILLGDMTFICLHLKH